MVEQKETARSGRLAMEVDWYGDTAATLARAVAQPAYERWREELAKPEPNVPLLDSLQRVLVRLIRCMSW